MIEPILVVANNIVDLDVRRLRERPSRRRLAWLDTVRAAEHEHAVHDDIVRAAASATTVELLRVQVAELARECAALRWDREHAADARERQRLASRRIRALRSLASAVLELHGLEGGEASPRVIAKVLDDLQDLVEGAVVELFDAHTAARCIGALRARLGPALDQVKAQI